MWSRAGHGEDETQDNPARAGHGEDETQDKPARAGHAADETHRTFARAGTIQPSGLRGTTSDRRGASDDYSHSPPSS